MSYLAEHHTLGNKCVVRALEEASVVGGGQGLGNLALFALETGLALLAERSCSLPDVGCLPQIVE